MATTSPQSPPPSRSTVFIVDDHPVLRRGLMALIESEPDLAVCGEAASSREAMEKIPARRPNVVIVDLMLDGSHGLELIKALISLDSDTRALVLSMHDESTYAERSLRAGAKGYVSKQQLDQTVLVAIRCILAGGIFMSDQLKARLALKFISGKSRVPESILDVLSDRELRVFELIGQGLTTRKIAMNLSLSIKTVESHVAHIKYKLNLESAAELVMRASRWIESGRTG